MASRAAPSSVFTVPAGAPFLKTFVDALLSRKLLPNFPDTSDPFSLGNTTIFVPTRRAARNLAVAFAAAAAPGIVMLPRILPLGDLDENEVDDPAIEKEAWSSATPAPIGEIERRLVLSRMVLKWAQELRHAIVSIRIDGQPELAREENLLVATSPAQAWHLAGDLSRLIDELTFESIPWNELDSITPQEFDHYWAITLEFLKIAVMQWPLYLEEAGLIDRARHRIDLVDAEIGRLQDPTRRNPVIAIGTTGTNKATARLLRAIAEAPLAGIVLPGLDMQLEEAAWAAIPGDRTRHLAAAVTHPQFALHTLVAALGLERAQVTEIGSPAKAVDKRMRLLREAMRPADTTDTWHRFRRERPGSGDELDEVTLIEAADEREEALALAIRMRGLLEQEGRTAALVTADRNIARRVQSELARWRIDIDDSAGSPLSRFEPASLARLVLRWAREETPINLIATLSHPLTRLGFAPRDLERLVRILELAVFRVVLPPAATAQEVIRSAREAARRRDAHAAVKAIGEEDWLRLQDLIERCDAAFAPLCAMTTTASLAAWIEAHRAVLTRLQTGPDDAGATAAAELLESMFDDLSGAAARALPVTLEGYAGLFNEVVENIAVRGTAKRHPRLQILGLLEARMVHADLLLLAGLDEGIWPPAPRDDAFLNRPMRDQLGLSSPDRRIGQSAHDFVMAMGADEVVISRAKKRDGAPTVPSRFLQRLGAVADPQAWRACKSRGDDLLAMARRLDFKPAQKIRRPEPRPPLALRPISLGVTRIETLRRDPYAIYAEIILRLAPLDPLGVKPGPREAGMMLHDALAEFSRTYPRGPLPDDAVAALRRLVEEKYEPFRQDPMFRTFQWPKLLDVLSGYVDWEAKRRSTLVRIDVEQAGKLTLPLADGTRFDLIARADKIETHNAGATSVIDFKSGRVPSENQIAAGFAPQLVLEAAMIERGAFAGATGAHVAEAIYLCLSANTGFTPSPVGKKTPLATLVAEQFEGLCRLLDQFRDVATPYIPRPFPQFVSLYGEYDHLARVAEWSSGTDAEDTP